MKKIILDINYFKDRVNVDEKWCWNWKWSINNYWYWNCSLNLWDWKKTYLVHRLIYELWNWKINNKNLFICHQCDNRQCCNPEHLFLWTAKDNSDDKRNKWRWIPPAKQYWNNYWGKKVLAWWIVFNSYLDAWRYFNISDNWIRKRIKLWWEWYWKI